MVPASQYSVSSSNTVVKLRGFAELVCTPNKVSIGLSGRLVFAGNPKKLVAAWL